MVYTRGLPRRLSLTLAVLGLAYLASQAFGAPLSVKAKELRGRAEHFEKVRDWDKACDSYEELLKLDRSQIDILERYRHCLQRINQVRRHRDASYQKQVLSLKYSQSLRLWELVTVTLLDASIEKKKVDSGLLFRKGLEELKQALREPSFLQEHLRGRNPDSLAAFLVYLAKYDATAAVTREEAGLLVRDIAIEGLRTLNLQATVTVMEFACGACHAIDDYTVYLTPSQINDLTAALDGQPVGVGLKLVVNEGRLVIGAILPDSPAAEVTPPLARDDQVVSIDKKDVGMLSPEMAMSLLEGENDSVVEVSLMSETVGPRTVMLRRRPVFVPSVEYRIKPGGLAYLQITSFQESTLTELDAALLALNKADVKGLILDLRGNGGGIFEKAIDAAKRFLSGGAVIVSTQHYNPKDNMVYRANGLPAFTLPMTVLVDGETASAAEVLAGALKENRRARLVGQTTFGKGCTQGLLRLPAQGLLNPVPPPEIGLATGGLRITVARFFSPSGQPYTGKGVVPHVMVYPRPMADSLDNDADHQLQAARLELVKLLDR